MFKLHSLDRYQYAFVQCGHLDVRYALLVPFNHLGDYFAKDEPRGPINVGACGNIRWPLHYGICKYSFALAGLLWRAFQGNGSRVCFTMVLVLRVPVLGFEKD